MSSPEAELKSIMSRLEWNYVRKEWSRRTRSKGMTGSYSDIFTALKELIQVIRLVIQAYGHEKHRKVYKRLGPQAKNGSLEQFLTEVVEFKTFLEDSFFYHLRKLIPHKIPNEILNIIWNFSQTGEKRFDFGFYSKNHLDQVCETIQRKKFLVLTKTLTINLINAIMMSKMDSRGLTIETLMEYFVKDAGAFKDLTDDDFEKADFSKFSKIPYVPYKKPRTPITTYLTSSSGKKPPSPEKLREHDYALSRYMM